MSIFLYRLGRTAFDRPWLFIAGWLAVLAVVVGRRRPDLVPRRSLPRGRALVLGIALSVAYQLTICLLLLGTVMATGHTLGPLALLAESSLFSVE